MIEGKIPLDKTEKGLTNGITISLAVFLGSLYAVLFLHDRYIWITLPIITSSLVSFLTTLTLMSQKVKKEGMEFGWNLEHGEMGWWKAPKGTTKFKIFQIEFRNKKLVL